MQNDAVVIFQLPKYLKQKAQRQAEAQGISLSAHLRRLVAICDDPDGETLRLAENKVEYEVDRA